MKYKAGTRYYFKLSTGSKLPSALETFKDEIGETLFEKCQPQEERPGYFSMFVPDGNQRRIIDTVRQGRAGIETTYKPKK